MIATDEWPPTGNGVPPDQRRHDPGSGQVRRIPPHLSGSLTIREGTDRDLPKVLALHERTSPTSTSLRYHMWIQRLTHQRRRARGLGGAFARQLVDPPDGWCSLAITGEVAVGMAVAARTQDDRRVVDMRLFVEDAWQRRGVGSALVTRVARTGASRGFEHLVAVTQPGNDAALRCFASIGVPVRARCVDGVLQLSAPLVGSPDQAPDVAELLHADADAAADADADSTLRPPHAVGTLSQPPLVSRRPSQETGRSNASRSSDP